MLVAITFLGLAIAQESTQLLDGQTQYQEHSSDDIAKFYFKLHVDSVETLQTDLTFMLTSFSDMSNPEMFIGFNSIPTETDYAWHSTGAWTDSIIIPNNGVTPGADYFVMVKCQTICRFSLTGAFTEETQIQLGVPINGAVGLGRQQVYKLDLNSNQENLKVILQPNTGATLNLLVAKGETPTTENSFPIETSWNNGILTTIRNARRGDVYKIVVEGVTDGSYTLKVVSRIDVNELQASRPIFDNVNEAEFNYYKIKVDDPEESLIVKLTPFSGDPDIYIRGIDIPSLDEYDFKAVTYGNDTLAISKHDRQDLGLLTGWYYIGIFGFSSASYTLTASINANSQIPLTPGISQNGYVEPYKLDYYYMDLPNHVSQNVTATVFTEAGNPDLFAKLCDSDVNAASCLLSESDILHPDRNPNIFSSRRSQGDDTLYIKHQDESCPEGSPCRYIFGVYGNSESRSLFSIVASYSDDIEHVLRQGHSVRMTLPKNGYRYFRYSVFNETVANVTFQLTPLSGDPDLFASRNISRPDGENYEKKSTNGIGLVDMVKFTRGVDGESLLGTYHVSVYGFGINSFSLMAKEEIPYKNSTIKLYPGHPQRDTVYNYTDTDYRIYSFNLHYTEVDKKPIRILVTPFTGDYSVYVANKPSNLDWEHEIFYYDWSTTNKTYNDQNYVLNINPSDHFYNPQSTYLILVYAKNFTSDLSATYSIVYTTGDVAVKLADSIPYYDEVVEKGYKNYTFPILYSHEDLTIRISALSGDPDLYLSINPNNTTPNKDQFDFKSDVYGSEVLTLQWEQGIQRSCPQLSQEWDFGQHLECYLYISVYGYKQSTYYITVQGQKNVPNLLLKDIAIRGQLNNTSYEYFYSYLEYTSIATFSVQPIVGDSDLYVNIIPVQDDKIGDWKRPNRENAMFSSQEAMVTETIKISSDQIEQYCEGMKCVAIIGVYCFSDMCRFDAKYTTGQSQILQEGQPIFGEVEEGKYQYYTYYCNNENSPFLIHITSLTDGDPDLYVSKGQDSQPTKDSYMWSSEGWKGEYLMINPNDPQLEDGIKGTYVIGVFGFSHSSYTLTVSNNPQPIIALLGGQPQRTTLDPNQVAYYTFYNIQYADIEVQLTPTRGSCDIYANFANEFEEQIYDKLPTLSDFVWSGSRSNQKYEIVIEKSDELFCTFCNIIVGVFSGPQGCSYSITAQSDLQWTLLESGVTKRTRVDKDSWDYYIYEILYDTDFDVSLTTYSGDADLYISVDDSVSSQNYQWSSTSTQRIDHVHVKTTDADFRIGKFFIGVYAFEGATYAITAHGRRSYVKLVSGWPITYSVSYNNNDDILFTYPFELIQDQPTYCKVTPLSPDFYPRVYVKYRQYGNNDQGRPSGALYDFKFDQISDYDNIFRTVQFKLEKRIQQGRYDIGVYGRSAEDKPKNELGDFEIYCGEYSELQVIGINRVDFAMLQQPEKHKRYELNLQNRGRLHVYVVPCSGIPTVEISSNYTSTSENRIDFTMSRLTDGKMHGIVENAIGSYFITVTEKTQSKMFEGISYQISTYFEPVGQRPSPQIVPGGEGKLDWSSKSGKKINLSWSAVEYEDGTPYSGGPVIYNVYVTKSPNLDLFSACAMRTGEMIDEAIKIGTFTNSTSVVVEVPWKETTISLNVLGIVPEDTEDIFGQKLVSYFETDVFIMETHGGRRGISKTIIWIIAILLFVTLLAAMLFYRSYQRVQKRLEYEMTDVRNVAGLQSNNYASRYQPHQPLNQEDEVQYLNYRQNFTKFQFFIQCSLLKCTNSGVFPGPLCSAGLILRCCNAIMASEDNSSIQSFMSNLINAIASIDKIQRITQKQPIYISYFLRTIHRAPLRLATNMLKADPNVLTGVCIASHVITIYTLQLTVVKDLVNTPIIGSIYIPTIKLLDITVVITQIVFVDIQFEQIHSIAIKTMLITPY